MKRVHTTRWGLWLALALAALLALAGCEAAGPADNPADSTTVGMSVDLTALLDQVTGGSGTAAAGGSSPMFTASDVMTGSLLVTDSGGTTQTFDWSIYLDAATLATESNKTIVLNPGTYDFSLLVNRGDQSYAGEALGVAIGEGENTVPITIRPVIGDTLTDVVVVARLVDFRFSYDPREIGEAAILDPRIGISIDGGPEEVFALDPATGLSEHMWLDLAPGPYNFRLRLYDGTVQRGRSVVAQEDVTVAPGVDLTMDLVALHGEVALDLTEQGGDAHFSFSIPGEVVEESGSTASLEVLWTMDGGRNGLVERVLTLSPDGAGNFTAQELVTPFDFDTVSYTLTFTDLSNPGSPELLGSCLVDSVVIDSLVDTYRCDLTLRRRSIISGILLATLGINVFDTDWQPVPGAHVYANGSFVGITGSGAFGTPGYLKTYLPAGDYTIRANEGTRLGSSPVSLLALGIANVDVILNGSLPTGGVAVFQNGAYVDMSPSVPAEAEALNVEDSIVWLGESVTTFTGITAADIVAATTGNRVLAIPEQEIGDLAAALDAAAYAAIGNFVADGGTLIVFGSYASGAAAEADVRLINGAIGTSLSSLVYASLGPFNLGADASGTTFEDGPPTVAVNNATVMVTSSLPATAKALYHDGAGNTAVALLPFGVGQVVYLGWDWFDAVPTGTQDGGWLDVLDRALRYPEPPPADVALFANTSYVDYIPGNYGSEASNLEESLLSQGHSVSTFVGITAADINAATAGKDVLALPEQQNGDLSAALDAAAYGAIEAFVNGGGTLAVFGTYIFPGADVAIINNAFGFALSSTLPGSFATTYSLGPDAIGTPFETGPSPIPWNDATVIVSSSLPPGGRALYLDTGGSGDISIAMIPYGSGKIFYLGWDWFNAAPVGTLDGGWLQVLDTAMRY